MFCRNKFAFCSIYNKFNVFFHIIQTIKFLCTLLRSTNSCHRHCRSVCRREKTVAHYQTCQYQIKPCTNESLCGFYFAPHTHLKINAISSCMLAHVFHVVIRRKKPRMHFCKQFHHDTHTSQIFWF
jgi:hypothetical protein